MRPNVTCFTRGCARDHASRFLVPRTGTPVLAPLSSITTIISRVAGECPSPQPASRAERKRLTSPVVTRPHTMPFWPKEGGIVYNATPILLREIMDLVQLQLAALEEAREVPMSEERRTEYSWRHLQITQLLTILRTRREWREGAHGHSLSISHMI